MHSDTVSKRRAQTQTGTGAVAERERDAETGTEAESKVESHPQAAQATPAASETASIASSQLQAGPSPRATVATRGVVLKKLTDHDCVVCD